VVRFLEEKQIGKYVGVTYVPIVCAAVLFDLKCGDSHVRPDSAMGYRACENSFRDLPFQSGNFGAGTGATFGSMKGVQYAMKGGVGAAAFQIGKLMVGAIVALNALGDVVQDGKIVAGLRSEDGTTFVGTEEVVLDVYQKAPDVFGSNTVLVCIITNGKFDKLDATRLAAHGQNAIARMIRPSHTLFDGDTVFAMCGGEVESGAIAAGILAGRAVEAAILDAVMSARPLCGYPSLISE
jgi:L-aminopeptidase/D-esterase-like protein